MGLDFRSKYTLTCIEKVRNEHDKILFYRMRDDSTGIVHELSGSDIKEYIHRGILTVTNLTITSDNRLITKKFELNAIDRIRSEQKDNKWYQFYQHIMDSVGVDIVGMAYIPIADDFSITDQTIVNSFDIALEFKKDPSKLLELAAGKFECNRDRAPWSKGKTTVKTYNTVKKITGINMEVRMPALVLHKNGQLQMVLLLELLSKDATDNHKSHQLVSKFVDKVSKSEDALASELRFMSKSFITIDNSNQPLVIDCGSIISDKERITVANSIINSAMLKWRNADTAKSILVDYSKVADNEQVKSVIKGVGLTVAVAPFTAVKMIGRMLGNVAAIAGTIDGKEVGKAAVSGYLTGAGIGFIVGSTGISD